MEGQEAGRHHWHRPQQLCKQKETKNPAYHIAHFLDFLVYILNGQPLVRERKDAYGLVYFFSALFILFCILGL